MKKTEARVKVSKILKRWMEENQHSVAWLGDELGLSYQTVYNWMHGRASINVETAHKLTKLSDIPAATWVGL